VLLVVGEVYIDNTLRQAGGTEMWLQLFEVVRNLVSEVLLPSEPLLEETVLLVGAYRLETVLVVKAPEFVLPQKVLPLS